MNALCHNLTLRGAEDTARFAARIGRLLRPGDCLLLEGPVGAGKTHFARHLIQSLMNPPEDVPSPTFTLVQTYETTRGEVWHADLYRLNSLDEVEELGLAEAFDTAICIVEWPDRLGPLTPPGALRLVFAPDKQRDDLRHVTLRTQGTRWAHDPGVLCND